MSAPTPPDHQPEADLDAAYERAAAARAEWKTMTDDERAERVAASWDEYRRRLAAGEITLPEQVS